jgi:hypothetical protein
MATKKEIRNYAEANGITREEARQHFINEAKNRKAKQFMVMPLEDAKLYKGKTVKQYIDDNNIADCIVAGTIFDSNLQKTVEVNFIISTTIDESAAMNLSKGIWEYNRKTNPTHEQFTVWMPSNNFLDLTISGTGKLALGHGSGYSGVFLAEMLDYLGMTEEFKDSLSTAYSTNKDFANALDSIDPKFKQHL